MPLDDSDDAKWIYHAHTEAKHEVLSKYLTPWTNKLTRYNERAYQPNRIRIVDAFAGRAKYSDIEQGAKPYELEHISTPVEIPGSPQIILDRLTDRADEYSEAEVVFIEADQENYDILSNVLEETAGYSSKIKVNSVHGRFENEALNVIEATDGSDFPTFFFIDPFGFKSLDYDVITEIGSTPQFEFLITFMARDMNRFLSSEDHEQALDRVFGTDMWRSEVDKYATDNWEPLVEYYTTRLEEEGPSSTFEYLITEADSTRTVYYLVFGTNHSEGMHTMREVMSHCGTGSFAYAPKHPEYDRQQQQLFGGVEVTKNFLMDRFSGYRISFSEMVRTCSEEEKYRDETEADYRDAIHELEEEDKISVKRISSSETGIQGMDLIDFPEN